MNPTQLRSFPIIDSHIHYVHPSHMRDLILILDELKVDRFNIVCTPHTSRLSLVPDALHLKAQYPNRAYVFGGLDLSPLFRSHDTAGEYFADYVDILLSLGCDGIKMHEGKAEVRKNLHIPNFDGKIYAPYWERMVERQVPLIFHVNDPEEFWDRERIPDWAMEMGWFYGNGDYVDNEEQYTEVLHVLDRHPDLKVIFAHFFFLSAQLPRLVSYFDRYPNMCVDLVPGIEMYFNLSVNPMASREFFIRYQDRILYGTDIGAQALLDTPEMGIELEESQTRVNLVKTFLESEDEFWLPEGGGFLFGKQKTPFQGLGLPQDVLEKIYFKNFERLAGTRPKALNASAIVEECERLILEIETTGGLGDQVEGDASVAQMVKTYFELQYL
jgi:predicted TIM-barrel fold metal-dependent hydrolase